MREDGGDSETVLSAFSQAGVDTFTLGDKLQRDGSEEFIKSWNELIERIAVKSRPLAVGAS
jgi:transaldolase